MRPHGPAQPGLAPGIFRECDIRGIFGRDLDVDTGEAVGAAFATFLEGAARTEMPAARSSTVVCGHDNRASSEALYGAVIRGLTRAGSDVAAIGLAVTPMMYFAVRHLDGRKRSAPTGTRFSHVCARLPASR